MNATNTQKLAVFGPNLRDQSKGQFVVHTADCKDCGKLRGEERFDGDFESKRAVAVTLYGEDAEEPNRIEWALSEIYFAPCVKFGGAK